MSKDKKLNNLLGMKDFSEKELEQKKAPTKRTGVAKDILQERYARPEGVGKYIAINEFDYASPEVKNWVHKNCSFVNCSQLDPTDITGLPYKGGYARPEWLNTNKIICFKDYNECSPEVRREIEKLNPAIFNGSQIDITDLQGLPLSESLTGKEPSEKAKTKDRIEKKGLNNLISLDEYSEKEALKDAKKTKRTEVAKDVLQEKAKPSEGLSKEKKSSIVKKAKKGENIGHGKFGEVASKAAKHYGSEEKGKAVAAAAMWKNIKR